MLKALKITIFFAAALFVATPLFVYADFGGQETTFFVDSSYDLLARNQVQAVLIRITPKLYFYLEKTWWSSLDALSQAQAKQALQDLGEEFEEVIYPELTALFGSESLPGIDGDVHITALFHPMTENSAGYVDTGNHYLRLQYPRSNQREMVYLSTSYLTSPLIKGYLAHEFTHLITFNQKERVRGKPEETWLNEARAEYVSTLLGYDSADYHNSNLKKRAAIFSEFPNDTLTEWQGEKADYGVLNLFTQYLAEHYGIAVLADSLKSDKIGIASLNYALKKNGFKETFKDIFTDWSIAVALNDCAVLDQNNQPGRYCYKNEYLRNVWVVPKISFLPFSAESSLALTEELKNWQVNWTKIIGGKGNLKLEFAGYDDVNFKVPYILRDKDGGKQLEFLELDSFQNGRIVLENFGTAITSLTIIPSVQSKTSGFSGSEKSYPFFWSVATVKEEENNGESTPTEDIKVLTEKIAFLEKQLALLKAQLKLLLTGEEIPASSQTITESLGVNSQGEQVRLLQQWLSRDSAVYPEALVTGWFGPLTKAAVIRFQEKYAGDILAPWNLQKGTGFVGSTTRQKLNQLYGN